MDLDFEIRRVKMTIKNPLYRIRFVQWIFSLLHPLA